MANDQEKQHQYHYRPDHHEKLIQVKTESALRIFCFTHNLAPCAKNSTEVPTHILNL